MENSNGFGSAAKIITIDYDELSDDHADKCAKIEEASTHFALDRTTIKLIVKNRKGMLQTGQLLNLFYYQKKRYTGGNVTDRQRTQR